MQDHPNTMISSTAKDLPEHRKQVVEACQRVGTFPLAMENLPADPDDAAKVSVRMIDDAEVCIECDTGQRDQAIAAATEAYRKAWCDGPPYAYHWGLQDARKLLAELGAPEPEMPPFDPSRYPPMPEVEIDPPEEPDDSSEADPN